MFGFCVSDAEVSSRACYDSVNQSVTDTNYSYVTSARHAMLRLLSRPYLMTSQNNGSIPVSSLLI
jgi:hypothetical protein